MQLLSRLKQYWNDLFSRKRNEAELDEEFAFHLEMQEKENLRAGMSSESASRAALIEFGGVEQIKEEVRGQRLGFWLETIFKDGVFGVRMLRKTPALTFVSLITLSLAIGACTALFSIYNAILLRPLPYPEPQELVQIWDTNKSKGITKIGISAGNVEDWKERSRGLNGIAAYYTMGRTLTDANQSEVVLTTQVSADFFRVFRTDPFLGRTFSEKESQEAKYNNALGAMNSDPVVVLSHSLWQRRFGSDPQILGKNIVLDRRMWKVIGVMPEHFAMPQPGIQLWIPWGLRHDLARDQHYAGGVARLASGMTLSQAEDQMNRIAQQLASEFPESNSGWGVRLIPLHESMIGDVKQTLWVLMSAVGLVMLIACVNVAILQLSRASARIHESSVRLALGASRGRLIRQFMIESLILAIAGGLLGLTIAYVCIDWLQKIQPSLPRLSEASIDGSVLFISFAITTLAALLFGLVPAFVGAGNKKQQVIQADGLRSTSRASTQRLRSILVAIEVALAVVLLASSGMLIRSFIRLQAVDPGFNPNNVLVVPIFLDMEKYGSGEKSRGYYKRLIADLQALPGVTSVGGATALPASPLGPDFERPVWSHESLPVEQNKKSADVRMVTTDYFRTLQIPIVKGRPFSTLDGPEAPSVVVINESLARQIWPGGDAIGRKIVVDYSSAGTYPYEVVGIVNDVRFYGLRSQPRPEIYFHHPQRPYLILNIAVRTKNDPRLLIGPVRKVLQMIDPQKPPHNITPLEDLVDATVVRDRYAMMLVSSFAIVALMLALLGIYGVLAFYVRQRIQEIGIRLALGASQNQIVSWIALQSARLILFGVAAGLFAAILFTRLLTGMLYEVSPFDVSSLVAAAFALIVAAFAATWIPARRASRIDPSIALRYE